MTNDHLLFLIVLGACCCGVVIALGVLDYVLWLAEHPDAERQERRNG